MDRWGFCASVAASLLMLGAPALSAEPWAGRPLSAAQRAACAPVPRPLVRAVDARRRAEAMALLQSQPAAALDDARAAAWIGVDAPPRGSLADRLLKDATDALLDRRDNAIGEHALKWSAAEQSRLDGLLRESAAPHPALKPILVRAVAGGEPGVFDAAVCGDGLAVRRLDSDGATPVSDAAVIVFVALQPVAVQAWREAPGR